MSDGQTDNNTNVVIIVHDLKVERQGHIENRKRQLMD